MSTEMMTAGIPADPATDPTSPTLAQSVQPPVATHPPDTPWRWVPRGKSGTPTGTGAVEVGVEPDGRLLLALRFTTDKTPRGLLQEHKDVLLSRLREKCLDALQNDPAYRRVSELRPQWTACYLALDVATKKHGELQAKLNALKRQEPAPKNLASRLASLGAEIDQTGEALKQAQTEHAALQPVWEEACGALRAVAPGLCQGVHAVVYRAEGEHLDERLASLSEQLQDTLSELARLRRGASGLLKPDAMMLAQMLIDSPEPEASGEESF